MFVLRLASHLHYVPNGMPSLFQNAISTINKDDLKSIWIHFLEPIAQGFSLNGAVIILLNRAIFTSSVTIGKGNNHYGIFFPL